MKINKWEKPACNLCGGNVNESVFKGISSWMSPGRFNVVKCINCGLVFLSPRPNEKVIAKYYNPDWYWGGDILKEDYRSLDKAPKKIYEGIYRNISLGKRMGNLLDIGAGTGLFLNFIRTKGWKISGTEISKSAVKFSRKVFGIKLKRGDFIDLRFQNGQFDAVTMNGVLEHLHEPLKTVVKIRKVLKRGGVLHASVPNFGGLGRKMFGQNWYALQLPTHLYHFTPGTIKKIFDAAGYKDLTIISSSFYENKYILFESLRRKFASRFNNSTKRKVGSTIKSVGKAPVSFKYEIAKKLAVFVAFVLALIEYFIGEGEIIYVYAKKD